MADLRSALHEEIDRMAERDLEGLKDFLATYPSRIAAVCRNAPWDDEPYTDEEKRLVEEGREWLKQNGGKGIPHEEVVRRLGLR